MKDVQRRVALGIRRLDAAHLLRRPPAAQTGLHALQSGGLDEPAPRWPRPVVTSINKTLFTKSNGPIVLKYLAEEKKEKSDKN